MFLYKHFLQGSQLGELDDVIRNLSNVLHTKRSTGYFLPNFGLTEVGYRTPEQMVNALKAELRENIRLYEPRIELIEIDEDYDDDGRRSTLAIRFRLRSSRERAELVFNLKENSFDIRPTPEPQGKPR